ncbi:MAG: hypothetical protein H6662_02305 [Ardenticatenaceae bacterium]|nr:hypothetical protein [Anaerolineales bacterium]MCB8920393.1 hypothetical protein [Ardenticatenaceae bacterium]MCB8989348.1 hypothetical protein [Ardenticatenaceae bacterium]MCB9004503.1 hypothetical protein [Ardenticatenaceae bacterium]
MNSLFRDTLDTALAELSTYKPVSDIATSYPRENGELRSLLQTAQTLKAARQVVMPSAEAAQEDRAAFITQLNALSLEPVPAVHKKTILAQFGLLLSGARGWFSQTIPIKRKSTKEWSPMSTILAKALVTLIILVGSVGGTAAMAADSLPNSPLYTVKTAMENLQLNMTNDTVEEANLQIELAQTRIQEMKQMALNGDTPDDATLARLQTHLETALQLAANAPDAQMNGLLLQAQLMLQGETPGMLQVQQQVHASAQEALGNAYQLMNQIGQEIEGGLQDPQTFRYRYTYNQPEGRPEPPDMEPNPGGVITHTMPITHTPPMTHTMPITHTPPITPSTPITTPVQAGPGYGPGEPGYGPGESGDGNPDGGPSYGPGEPSGYEPGTSPGAGSGPSQSNSPADSGSDSPGTVDASNNPDSGQNGGSDNGGGGDNGGGNGGH